MENERTELADVEAAVKACNAVAVPDPVRLALVRDLRPVANRLAGYALATAMIVGDAAEADEATRVCTAIALDIKAVKDHEVLSKITAGLHDLHRKWTGLRDLFISPMERDRRIIKGKVITWQTEEKRKADALAAKLQAEADAKAARERLALQKKAESVKSPEKKEAYQEQAVAVIAPTIHVDAPKSGLRTATVWKVKKIDQAVFFAALGNRPDLRGFVKILETGMERVKAANPSCEIPGILFEIVVR